MATSPIILLALGRNDGASKSSTYVTSFNRLVIEKRGAQRGGEWVT